MDIHQGLARPCHGIATKLNNALRPLASSMQQPCRDAVTRTSQAFKALLQFKVQVQYCRPWNQCCAHLVGFCQDELLASRGHGPCSCSERRVDAAGCTCLIGCKEFANQHCNA